MNTSDSIGDYLVDQHLVLELGLSAIERAVAARALVDARARLAAFRTHLERYVRGEERVLFPLYERLASARCEPTARMRREHGRLRRMVAAVAAMLATDDAEHGRAALDALRSVLFVHGTKEDWMIYPQIMGALPAARHEALVRALRDGTALR